jgi:hypothetical protein
VDVFAWLTSNILLRRLTNLLGCDKFQNDILPEECLTPDAQPTIASIYFPLYVILTSYIGVNLVTAIVVTSNEDVVEEVSREKETRRKIEALQQKFGQTNAQVRLIKQIFDLLDYDGSLAVGGWSKQANRKLINAQRLLTQKCMLLSLGIQSPDIVELQLALEQAHVSISYKGAARMMKYIDPKWKHGRGVDFPSFMRFFVPVLYCKASNQPTLPELLAGFKILAALKHRVKERKRMFANAMMNVLGEPILTNFYSLLTTFTSYFLV